MNIQKQWRARNICLLLASTMTVMAGATLAPSLPGMSAAFQNQPDAEFWVKMIVAIPGLLIAITAPFIGKLLDQRNKKRILLIALLGYGIFGSIGFFINNSLLLIFISRVLLGATVAGVMVTCITLAGRYFTGPSLGRYMGLQAAFGSFGGVVFLAGAGLLAELHWSTPFLIYTSAFILLPFCAIFINEPEDTPIAETPTITENKQQDKRVISLCCMLAGLEVFVLYLIPLHFPFYVQQFDEVATPKSTGLAIAAMLLVSALVSINYRLINGRLSFDRIHSIGLILVSLGLSCLALATSFSVSIAGLLIIGFGVGIIRPNVVVWLFAHTPIQQRGAVSGRLTSFFFIGQILCPIISQPFISLLGHTTTYLLTALLTVSVAIAIAYISKTKVTMEKAVS